MSKDNEFKSLVELGVEGDNFRVRVKDKMNVFQAIGTLEYAKQVLLTGIDEEEVTESKPEGAH